MGVKGGGAILPLPHTPSWCGAQLIKHGDEHDKKEPKKKKNSNLLEKQVLTPEDGKIGPKHVENTKSVLKKNQ
jgi:hypothetical protein